MGMRKPLPVGSLVRIHENLYRISGEVIGSGGGSLVYPAERVISAAGELRPDGMQYALKESFPVYGCSRDAQGQIVPDNEDAAQKLARANQMQLAEGEITAAIYRKSSHMLPIREAAETVTLTVPGGEAVQVRNAVTVMDSLAEKGRSLGSFLKEYRRFPAAESFSILQQLLFGLREIHGAGFLHLDIQEGNIFLQGSLQDGAALVSFIDFGTARKMEQGKTAPITDRVIFSSEGFTAPEILLSNDGTLCLTPAADLFSAGCLAYYMLTGTKLREKDVLYHTSGDYLNLSQLRRLKCARHLYPKIQRFLSRALETDPEKRYASVDAMLEDVKELAQALRPYRSDLKDVLYDAFVCYKHGPIDSEAAITLQRRLEQFRTLGRKKPFSRVFVDEGELSSCSDFGEMIRDALKNSGWLIVLCSPDTPTSPWVQKEIETFLEYHDRSRILAVLTGGDPAQSFPPLLLGSDGQGEILAADARADSLPEVLKKLKGDALLKIAAPMLGTTFDTLKDRRRIYALQRAAAAAAVFAAAATGFTAYAVNRANVISAQNTTIQMQADELEAEYRQTLLTESRFLTGQAQKRLDDSDPLAAVELALEALPSAEQPNRPILPETEYVLSSALGVYETPASAVFTASPIGVMDIGVDEFWSSGDYLFTRDKDGGIQVWSIPEMKTVQSILPNEYCSIMSEEMVYPDAREMIVQTATGICRVNFLTGKILWKYDLEDVKFLHITEDQKKLVAVSGIDNFWGGLQEDRTPLTAVVLSAEDGTVEKQFSFAVDTRVFLSESNLSADGSLLVFSASPGSYAQYSPLDPLQEALYLLNLAEESIQEISSPSGTVYQIAFLDDSFAVVRGSDLLSITKSGYSELQQHIPGELVVDLFASDGTNLWSSRDSLFPSAFEAVHLFGTGYYTGKKSGNGIVLSVGTECRLYDQEDGTLLRRYLLDSPLLTVDLRANGLRAFCGNDTYLSINYDRPYFITIPLLSGIHASTIQKKGDLLLMTASEAFAGNHSVYICAYEKHSDGFRLTAKTDDNASSSWKSCFVGQERVLFANNLQSAIGIARPETGEFTILPIPDSCRYDPYRICSVSDDGRYLYWNSTYSLEDSLVSGHLWILDTDTGLVSEAPCQLDQSTNISGAFVYQNRVLYVTNRYSSNVRIVELNAIDCFTGESKVLCQWDDLGKLSYRYKSLHLDAQSGTLWFVLEDDFEGIETIVSFDLNSESAAVYSCKLPEAGKITSDFVGFYPASKYAHFGSSDRITVFDGTGTVAGVVKPDSETGKQLTASVLSPDGKILLLSTSGREVICCDVASGSETGRIALSDYNKNSSLSTPQWTFLDDRTVIVSNSAQTVGFMLQLSDGIPKMQAVIYGFIDYDAESNSFTVGSHNESITPFAGTIPRYSTEELIRLGHERLGHSEQE